MLTNFGVDRREGIVEKVNVGICIQGSCKVHLDEKQMNEIKKLKS